MMKVGSIRFPLNLEVLVPNFSGDSLRGQNKGRRAAGTGSSPVLPTISKVRKTELWNKLRELDRRHALQTLYKKSCQYYLSHGNLLKLVEKKLLSIDNKRKSVRLKLKGYK